MLCALIDWFGRPRDHPGEDTGLCAVRPESNGPHPVVVHLDCIPRAIHLIGNYGSTLLPVGLHFSLSLDIFHSYFVNTYADHRMHESPIG